MHAPRLSNPASSFPHQLFHFLDLEERLDLVNLEDVYDISRNLHKQEVKYTTDKCQKIKIIKL